MRRLHISGPFIHLGSYTQPASNTRVLLARSSRRSCSLSFCSLPGKHMDPGQSEAACKITLLFMFTGLSAAVAASACLRLKPGLCFCLPAEIVPETLHSPAALHSVKYKRNVSVLGE